MLLITFFSFVFPPFLVSVSLLIYDEYDYIIKTSIIFVNMFMFFYF
ncbi:hypothetical protein CLOSTASPAR_06579 [[Clostridium] asparagiforme DSM 15981]|uniref:Uncharacterized protein n=1 Tax=[Clostridium] asparagiforme DSM 15981 TaxID=518636 RepID=C0DBC5_9FIRM|nr:hypothetical protein CLOSTASPAR_06579 [[Clostridium] asparagiforme DSM 15981]